MPVEFLTSTQRQKYGRFAGEPTPEQLARYFHLDDNDLFHINRHNNRQYTRLGFALQLCTVRFLGTFLSDPLDVPDICMQVLAVQLGIKDWSSLSRYAQREATYRQDRSVIQTVYGYRSFSDPAARYAFLRWVATRYGLTSERRLVVFDLATRWLSEHKILLPGATVLERCVAHVCERLDERLWTRLDGLLSEEQHHILHMLLQVPVDSRFSYLVSLRTPPSISNSRQMAHAVRRFLFLRSLGFLDIDLSSFPPSRIKALADYGITAWAQKLDRLTPLRRSATLLTAVQEITIRAQDEALTIFDELMGDALNASERKAEEERLARMKFIEQAVQFLRLAGQVVLNEEIDDVRGIIFSQVSPEKLKKAVEATADLPLPHHFSKLSDYYSAFRQFIPLFVQAFEFQGIDSSLPILDALDFLYQLDHMDPIPSMQDAPQQVITPTWKPFVKLPDGAIHRPYYSLCTLEQTRLHLRRRDIFLSHSHDWSDPRIQLIPENTWPSIKRQVCRSLGLSTSPEHQVRLWQTTLDQAFRHTASNLPANEDVQVSHEHQRDRLVLGNLDELPKPIGFNQFEQEVEKRLPQVDLPDLMLEIHHITRFGDAFTHITESESRSRDFITSLCAVLLTDACNIPLEPVIVPDNEALTYGRLLWIKQNYVRLETLAYGNLRFLDTQQTIPLAHAWGGGEVASADGLRFKVPVHSLHTRPNSQYFGSGRGLTLFNFSSDQFMGFKHIVVPGAVRDSPYILDGLLDNPTSLDPIEIMTDTASYTDIVFGLFWLLGYQFSPRMRDIGAMRFWRIDKDADYGLLNDIARHRISQPRIFQSWDDILRTAGSLQLRYVQASHLMRTLQFGGRVSSLGKAIQAIGRIAKTLYLLAYIDDKSYRRRVLVQVNRGEGRHRLMRAVFHGGRGNIRKRFRQAQAEQLMVLGFVSNMIILWNTIYQNAIVEQLEHEGWEIPDSYLARLSPLGFAHINLHGRYTFNLQDLPKPGQLRPLRDPGSFLPPIDWRQAGW